MFLWQGSTTWSSASCVARIAAGLLDDPPQRGPLHDRDAHASLAEEAATRGIVLLKNRDGALPLPSGLKQLLVVGGHADQGVLSGGGSSQVVPVGSVRFPGQPAGAFYGKPRLFDPSPPLAALRAALPGTRVDYSDGHDRDAAARAARGADAVIVLADAWRNESRDASSLALPDGQDALVAALAGANPRTIVVLETGGPVTMPWHDAVAAIVEAWYPGERGAAAIADVLVGHTDPGGRLPMTFPVDEAQLPRPIGADPETTTSNPGEPIKGPPFVVDYDIEGPDVGYKWFLRTGRKPLFPFGFGLSYTRMTTTTPTARGDGGRDVTVTYDVRNDGARAGNAVTQIYADGPGFTRRLVGFATARLEPGTTRHVSMSIDPRLLARFDVAAHGWRIAAGRYTLAVRPDALADGPATTISLPASAWSARHTP